MKDENIFQKIFGTFSFGAGKQIPLRSNVFGKNGRGGYNPIGTTGSRLFNSDRTSPLLGNAQPSKRLSGWYERVSELKQYELLDITKLAISFFRDYVNNFLNTSTNQMVTILDEEGNEDTQKTERINEILSKDIKLFDYIRDHLDEVIYYGAYYSMLRTKKDERGHTRFHIYGLYDPVSVVIKRTFDKEEDEVVEEFIARGDDGNVYVIPSDECFYLGSPNMRINNDLKDEFSNQEKKDRNNKPKLGKEENRDKVMEMEYYTAGEPMFYSNILKVKELVVKELLVSLLSLRDLTTPSILALMFDKGVPMENAEDLCNKVQRMLNSYNDLASFTSAQFDVTSLIENILTQTTRVIPDYNATVQNKGLISTDKLGDRYMEILQSLDITRQAVLSPLGLPLSILDSTIGNKWAILQSSERANSRVNSFMTGIKESVSALVGTIYKILYDESLDLSCLRLHVLEKSTVEYNNALNTLENVNGLVGGISGIITNALQTLEVAGPLLDTEAFVSYIQNMIKDADPNASKIITQETLQAYTQLMQAKIQATMEQFGGGEAMM